MPIPPDTRSAGDSGHIIDHNNIADELTALTGGAVTAGGDLTGTAGAAQVTGTHLASPLPVAQGGTASASRVWAGLLTPTAVKTSAYTAAAGDFVPVDTTSGNVTVTLPNAPPDLTVVAVKHVIQGGTNVVTFVCAGSDVFNKAGGGTSGTLPLASQGAVLQYKAAGGIWYVTADDLPLSQLDGRYPRLATASTYTADQYFKSGRPWFDVVAFGADPTGTADSTAAFQLAINTALGLRTDTAVGFTAASATVTDPAAVSGDNGLYLTSQNFPRTDAGCGTNTTTTVTDPSAQAGDLGRTITGTNIPSSTTITAVNPGVGYTISNTATGTTGSLTFTVIGGIGGYAHITAVTPGVGYTVSVAATATLSAQTATAGTSAALSGRTAKGPVYIPAGTYKITSDVIIRSVLGFRLLGAGVDQARIMPSGTGFSSAVLLIDGSLDGVYEGFQIQGDTTEQVTDGIRLDFTTAAQRSTTGNVFRDIRVRNLNFVTGLSLESNGTRQLDGTYLFNVTIYGGQTAGAWSASGNWQNAIAVGNGSAGNVYDQAGYGISAAQCYNGVNISSSGMSVYSGQFLSNAVDFQVNPYAQLVISDIQSQNSQRFLVNSAGFSPKPVTVMSCLFNSAYIASDGKVIQLAGGTWQIRGFSCATSQLSGSYVPAVITIAGAGASRPGVVTMDTVTLNNTLAAGILPTASEAQLVVSNYSNFDPVTSHYTVTPFEYYNGTSWVTPGAGPSSPDIQVFGSASTSGAFTWTKPAGMLCCDTILIGATGGGGSGSCGAAGTIRTGGGGSSGGNIVTRRFMAADCGSTETVNVGVAGAGGTGVTTIAGNAGSAPTGSTTFGSKVSAPAGIAGSASPGTTAAGAAQASVNAGNGGGSSVSGAPASQNPNLGGGGGGGGGTIPASNTPSNGAHGSSSVLGNLNSTGAAGVVDTSVPASGTGPANNGTPGCGAGGGAASVGAPSGSVGPQAGANGNWPGGGAGGGGASLSPNTSGAGGNGANGCVYVISYFQ